MLKFSEEVTAALRPELGTSHPGRRIRNHTLETRISVTCLRKSWLEGPEREESSK